jgi:hypothetical protein
LPFILFLVSRIAHLLKILFLHGHSALVLTQRYYFIKHSARNKIKGKHKGRTQDSKMDGIKYKSLKRDQVNYLARRDAPNCLMRTGDQILNVKYIVKQFLRLNHTYKIFKNTRSSYLKHGHSALVLTQRYYFIKHSVHVSYKSERRHMLMM